MNRTLLISLSMFAVILLIIGCSPNAESPAGPTMTGAKMAQPAAGEEVKRQTEERDQAITEPAINRPRLSGEAERLSSPSSSMPAAPASVSRSPVLFNKVQTKTGLGAEQAAGFQSVARQERLDALRASSDPVGGEQYAHQEDNPVKRAAGQPVSTFSIDVDTGAYANVWRFLNQGRLPPQDTVRVEERVNYFDYDYPLPGSRQPPFRVNTELAPAPWNSKTLLLAIGIKGYPGWIGPVAGYEPG